MINNHTPHTVSVEYIKAWNVAIRPEQLCFYIENLRDIYSFFVVPLWKSNSFEWCNDNVPPRIAFNLGLSRRGSECECLSMMKVIGFDFERFSMFDWSWLRIRLMGVDMLSIPGNILTNGYMVWCFSSGSFF